MAALQRVVPYESPGYRRVRRGESFRYLDADGKAVPQAERERVVALAVPPAWCRVWLAASADAHILAVGLDAEGRRQYLYHPEWRSNRDEEKFLRARRLAAALPTARRLVTRDLRISGVTEARALAAAFRILDSVAIRVGGEHYALVHGTRGLTTLQRGDVIVAGDTSRLSFPSKGGRQASAELVDRDLARALRALGAGSGRQRLLAWRADGRTHRVSAAGLNAYLSDRAGGAFTAKDFRTLKGTIAAAVTLAHHDEATDARALRAAVREAVAAAALGLGNTPAVARASYIDPELFSLFELGRTLRLDRSPEVALLELLDGRSAKPVMVLPVRG
jgi:DNA topoisomerase IB